MSRRLQALLGLLFVVGSTATMAWILGRAEDGKRQTRYDVFASQAGELSAIVADFIAQEARWQQQAAQQHLKQVVTTDDLGAAVANRFRDFALVLDDDGVVMAAYPPRDTIHFGDELASQFPHLQAALEGRIGVSTVFATSETDTGTVLGVAVPFTGSDGQARVLSTAFQLSSSPLVSLLDEVSKSQLIVSRSFVLDGQGQLVSAAGPRPSLSAADQVLGAGADDGELVSLLQAESTDVHAFGPNLVATRAVEGTPWHVALVAPKVAVEGVAGGTVIPLARVTLVVITGVFVIFVLVLVRSSRLGADAASSREDATRRASELEVLFSDSATATVVVRAGGEVSAVNKAACALLGRTEHELAGRNLRSVLAPGFDSTLVRRALDGDGRLSVEVEAVRSDGLTRVTMMAATPLRSDPDEVRVVIQLVDVTEERKQARLLHRSLESLETFARAAAHDLRTPLASISAMSEVLADLGDQLPADERDQLLERIRVNAVRASDQVAELLAEAQSLTGADPTELDLERVSAWLSELLSGTLSEAAGQIVARPPTEPIQVPAPPVRQVLLNLVTNSLKYASPERSPHIELSAARDNGEWRFSVTDNGLGVPDDALGSIFDPGVRLRPDQAAGTGLGLASCKEIVERLGGKIWAEAAEPRQGLRVLFTVPADA